MARSYGLCAILFCAAKLREGRSSPAPYCASSFELPVAADYQVVTVGAIEAEHIEDDDALGGVDDLADAEEGFALGDAEHLSGALIGNGGIDFFVGVAEFDAVVALDRGEERSVLQGHAEQAGKLGGGEVAGFESERFARGGAEAFELEDAAFWGEREASGGLFFVVDDLRE